MAYQFPPDVETLVKQQMTARGYTSEDDVLRDALEALGQFAHSTDDIDEEFRQTVTAVTEGVTDMEAGRMRTLRAILDEARDEHSFECDSVSTYPPAPFVTIGSSIIQRDVRAHNG